MKTAIYALIPLAVLVILITLACFIGYGITQIGGDFAAIDKIISKSTQILLVLGIFPLKKYLKINWQDLGFSPRRVFFKQLLQGLLLALATLLPILLVLYALDVHIYDQGRTWSIAKISEKIGLGLFLAFLVAIFEEIIFRGILLTSLRQKMPIFLAILITSFYYAALHFLKSKTSFSPSETDLWTCFQLMAEAFNNWLNPAIISAMTALFFVGLFLALLRTTLPNSLGLCIGCHCGWVWQIKLSKDFFNVNPQADYLFLVSNYDGVIGPLVSIWLGLASLGFVLLRKRNPNFWHKHITA